METNQNKEIKKGLTGNQKIIIGGFIVLIIVIVVAAVIIYMQLNKPIVQGGNLVIDSSNLTEVGDIMKEEVADSMFEVNMNTIWHFTDSKSASYDAYIANSSANHYTITFDILIGSEQKNVYTSTAIPVGNQIKEVILSEELPAGEYDAVCNYHLLKEDGSENSSLAVNITVVVEN